MDSIDEEKNLPYESLDISKQQIRLVYLKHRSNRKRHTPRYRLRTFDIDEVPPYKAVSYTWGPESPTNTIYLNGHLVEIRANLFAFLRTYRGEGYVWIDQICIDQTNTQERNHQVQLMSQIYKDSDSVIVWLGSSHKKFVEAANEFSRKPKLKPLSTLLRDAYFRRLWIVQEILLAREVQVVCRGVSGPIHIPWANLRAIANITSLWLQERGHPKRVLSLLARQGTTRYESLRWCIGHFSGYDCHDPRDKVYGLLGIVKERQRLAVDYNKSVQEVLLDVVRVFYKRGESRKESYAACRSTIETLARQMGMDKIDNKLQGLQGLLIDVFSRGKTYRSRTAGLPKNARITDIGYDDIYTTTEVEPDTGEIGVSRSPHWWCKFEGETYLHACCSCNAVVCCKCNPGEKIARDTFEPFEGLEELAKLKAGKIGKSFVMLSAW